MKFYSRLGYRRKSYHQTYRHLRIPKIQRKEQTRYQTELAVLGKYLWCCSCKDVLSLQNIEEELRRGLGSLLQVRCHRCLIVNLVPTGKRQPDESGRLNCYDVDAKAAQAISSSGCKFTQFTQILSGINMPNMGFPTFKRYERMVEKELEIVAKESSMDAAAKERELTIQRKEEIEKLLPLELDNFIITQSADTQSAENRNEDQENLVSESTDGLEQSASRVERIVTLSNVVRIMIAYDMGWSKKEVGRLYHSLNGNACIVGAMSGLVLDYLQCNRKCRFCDLGNDPSTHDCRLNYWGSGKGMEAHATKKLVANSPILKKQNLEAGIFVGDDDSTAVAAARKEVPHPIMLQSDMNHASEGVQNTLYKIEKKT